MQLLFFVLNRSEMLDDIVRLVGLSLRKKRRQDAEACGKSGTNHDKGLLAHGLPPV